MSRRRNVNCAFAGDFRATLEAIKIDISVIKNELKWHRYLITTIFLMLLTLLAKIFFA